MTDGRATRRRGAIARVPTRGGGGDGSPRRAPLAAVAMLAPLVVFTVVFGLVPIAESVRLAMHRTEGPDLGAFVGLANLARLAGDADFLLSVRNTAVYAAASVAIQVPLGLGLALACARPGRLAWAARAAIFAPNLVGPPFAAVLFTVILSPRFGPLNRVLAALDRAASGLGVPADVRWLADPALVLPTTVAIAAWLGVGFNMVFFDAALRGVDRSLHEAAVLEGAGPAARFRAVTLPAIAPVLGLLVVLNTILAIRVFELPWILERSTPGPDKSAMFVVTYLYEAGFVRGDLGYASAIGWVVTAAVVALAAWQHRLVRRWGGGA